MSRELTSLDSTFSHHNVWSVIENCGQFVAEEQLEALV